MKLYLLSFFLPLFLFMGCDLDPTASSSSQSSDTVTQEKQYIDIFTLAPAQNLLLQDAQNQVALYDETNQSYYFKESITYPISATTTSKTYINVDYDKSITSADLVPSPYFSTTTLESFCPEVNFLTSYYYEQKMDENNISVESYKDEIQTRFGLDICAEPLQHKENAIALFGAYNAIVKNNALVSLDDIEAEVTKVEEFFTDYLSFLTTDEEKVKYYSFYDALLELDKGVAQRADTGHIPLIPKVVKTKSALVQNNSAVDVFDVRKYNDTLFLAAGHDELASTDTSLENLLFSEDVSLNSFGSKLNLQEYNATECLFLADAKEGLVSFKLDGTTFTKEHNKTITYRNSANQLTDLTISGVANINNYVSLNQNKRLLGISTIDKGYYLLNIKDSFENCNRIAEIDEDTDFIISEQSGSAVDATFRDDGTYLYVAHKGNGLFGYKTDILDLTEVKNSLKTFTLKDSQEVYNLKLYNNDNELFVTTDKGLLIYDVGSSRDELSYVSEYLSEGAQKDYYPSIDSFEDYIFMTDGYKGVKVLKLDNSFRPMLCGVEYFAPEGNDYELSKTTSVRYYDGYLYVGVASQGIAKLKLDDLLFEHCK